MAQAQAQAHAPSQETLRLAQMVVDILDRVVVHDALRSPLHVEKIIVDAAEAYAFLNDAPRVLRGHARLFPRFPMAVPPTPMSFREAVALTCVLARLASTDLVNTELNDDRELHLIGVSALRMAARIDHPHSFLWPVLVHLEREVLTQCLSRVQRETAG